ncbi:hypothetical protein DKX38_013021 [Salix brachista]|uniref:Uncharacterized protein n=1 Tax=Salix brachista TaxID=2182728 RepID=A0A5N5LQ87_9ROSI|nr:hypothetical protein DKX38_013021 [Salix brachista]
MATVEKHGQLKQEPHMKRKHGVEGEGEERDRVADEEEEKINSFYTLVRNIRDAHDQVLTGCKEKGKGKEVDGRPRNQLGPHLSLWKILLRKIMGSSKAILQMKMAGVRLEGAKQQEREKKSRVFS